MNKQRFVGTIILCMSVLISACIPLNSRSVTKDANLIAESYRSADYLVEVAKGKLSPSHPILITSFVNLDELTSSSTFGRMTGEQHGSRMSQKGYSIIEMKLRNSVFIKENTGRW